MYNIIMQEQLDLYFFETSVHYSNNHACKIPVVLLISSNTFSLTLKY